MKESAVQASIIRNMEKAGWLVVKILQCNRNGWPDLQCHRDGYTLFIEVKADGKKPSALQGYRHKQLREKGFSVIVTSNKDFVYL
jgi:Holliday junction resolvase